MRQSAVGIGSVASGNESSAHGIGNKADKAGQAIMAGNSASDNGSSAIGYTNVGQWFFQGSAFGKRATTASGEYSSASGTQ